jgi:uncharacterized protein (TIGR03084 family)
MVDLAELLTDLDRESADLDRIVAGRSEVQWSRPTPAPGWTVAHQISHLAWTDRVALDAVTRPEEFTRMVAQIAADPEGYVDRVAAEGLGPELLDRWRDGRARLVAALGALSPGVKVPWFATAMSAASMATARLMETWAHGQDVADALGVTRQPTARLRHVVHIGYRTLGFSFATHGRPVPTEPVRVELSTPDGALWMYGPAEATNRVIGPALDFCLLVTQRRHPADLALQASGPVASEWMEVAQAFAGPPGAGRQPLSGRRPASAGEPTAGDATATDAAAGARR